MRDTVEAFARDFGYDLDEEGQPLDEEAPLRKDESAVEQEPRAA